MAKVLVVADGDWVSAELVGPLARRGLETLTTPDSRAAIDICYDEAPDAVVCDSQVGSMGAMAVCRSVKSAERAGDLPPTPVVIVLDRKPDTFLARRAGADAWLVKPLQPAAVRWTMDVLLSGGEWSEAALEAELSGEGRFARIAAAEATAAAAAEAEAEAEAVADSAEDGSADAEDDGSNPSE